MHSHSQAEQQDASFFTVSRVLTGLAVGTALVGGAIILAPHILPAFGIGGADFAQEAAAVLHNGPTGLAGSINSVLEAIPLIGTELAKGGLVTALSSGLIGIGGVVLSHFLEKKEDGSRTIKWSSVIRWGALATSALIALPTVLSALGTGIIYLSMLADLDIFTPSETVAAVAKTIGSLGGKHSGVLMGASGLAAAIPHLALCSMPVMPAALSMALPKNESFAERVKQKRVLHADDANRFMTPQEQAWVDTYNEAPAPLKATMQSWFRQQGYTPDFHADGTVHLYQHKHPPTPARG